MKKYLAALVAAASLTAVTAGCSQDSGGHNGMDMGGSSETTSGKGALPDGVNEADVSFVQGMMPHHEQAVEMAEHVLEDGVDPEVNALAKAIKDAQAPEIEQMTGWLDDWGRNVSEGDHSSMDGMMSDSEMEMFSAASGAELDTMFLEMMTAHHEGAIAMAESEIENGEDADAIALAMEISTSQQAEIGVMQRLISALEPA